MLRRKLKRVKESTLKRLLGDDAGLRRDARIVVVGEFDEQLAELQEEAHLRYMKGQPDVEWHDGAWQELKKFQPADGQLAIAAGRDRRTLLNLDPIKESKVEITERKYKDLTDEELEKEITKTADVIRGEKSD